MGYNTGIVILNDRLHEIEKDKNFGKKLVESICDKNVDPKSKQYFGSFETLPSRHADEDQFIVIGQNSIRDHRELSDQELINIIRQMANERGIVVAFR